MRKLHRENPVFITGNGFAVCALLSFDQGVPKNCQVQRHLLNRTPSDGIYIDNFVSCFIVYYLNAHQVGAEAIAYSYLNSAFCLMSRYFM